jgi:hypothetical protein
MLAAHLTRQLDVTAHAADTVELPADLEALGNLTVALDRCRDALDGLEGRIAARVANRQAWADHTAGVQATFDPGDIPPPPPPPPPPVKPPPPPPPTNGEGS